MAVVTVTHQKTSGVPSILPPTPLVTPADWNATHVVHGLENVPNVDTTNASNITSGVLAVPFNESLSLTGTATATLPGCQITVTDNVAVTFSYTDANGNFTPEGWGNVNTLQLNWTGAGPLSTGARTPLLANLFFKTPSNVSNVSDFYAGAILTCNIYTDDNGVLGAERGDAFGLASVTYLKSTVKHWAIAIGAEFDFNVEAGAAVLRKIGCQVSSFAGGNGPDAVQGSQLDTAFLVNASAGCVGFKNGYTAEFSALGGNPFSSDGTLLKTVGPVTMANAIDVASATVTGNLLKSGPLTITGQGAYALKVASTLAGDIAAFSLYSSAAGQHIFSTMGRGVAAPDLVQGVAGLANEFMPGTVAGDVAMAYSGNLFLGHNGSAPHVTLSTGGVVAINNLTASSAVATDGSKNLVSVANSGTGNNVLVSAMRGQIAGLTLSMAGGSATFGIAVGVAADSTAVDVMTLGAAFTKTTSAWAVGTAAGSLDTGAIANATWYHVYQIKRPDTGGVDIAVSLSAANPTTGGNIPAAYTLFRRIGSMLTDVSAHWVKFIQDGDNFTWDVPANDFIAVANPGTAAILRTISVPLGINTFAVFHSRAATITAASAIAVLYTDPAQTATAPDFNNAQMIGNPNLAPFSNLRIRTNTLSQIRVQSNFSDANVGFYLITDGWVDSRGRFA